MASQQHLYAQQMNGSRSSSPQPMSPQMGQMTAQQQQWMAQQYQQQQAMSNQSSMNDLMREHQKQWQEHLEMSSKNNLMQQSPASDSNMQNTQNTQSTQSIPNYGSALSLNQMQQQQQQQQQQHVNNNWSTAQYAAWQNQYQQQRNMPQSAMNMQNYQLQQQRMLQQQAMMAQYQQQQMMAAQQQQQQQQSQRALFQQQARVNQNFSASTGHLGGNQGNMMRNNNQFRSANNMNKLDEEQEDDSIDHEHESFVPPAPQSNQEVEKYVKWQAKRKGIDDQKRIDIEVQKRQKIAALQTEKEKEDNFVSVAKNSNAYKQPLLSEESVHKDSDIDYALMDQQQQKSGGCCCVVL